MFLQNQTFDFFAKTMNKGYSVAIKGLLINCKYKNLHVS